MGTPTGEPAPADGLVGRRHELGALRIWLAGAQDGVGRPVLCVGVEGLPDLRGDDQAHRRPLCRLRPSPAPARAARERAPGLCSPRSDGARAPRCGGSSSLLCAVPFVIGLAATVVVTSGPSSPDDTAALLVSPASVRGTKPTTDGTASVAAITALAEVLG